MIHWGYFDVAKVRRQGEKECYRNVIFRLTIISRHASLVRYKELIKLAGKSFLYDYEVNGYSNINRVSQFPSSVGGCSPPITGEPEGVGAQRAGW